MKKFKKYLKENRYLLIGAVGSIGTLLIGYGLGSSYQKTQDETAIGKALECGYLQLTNVSDDGTKTPTTYEDWDLAKKVE